MSGCPICLLCVDLSRTLLHTHKVHVQFCIVSSLSNQIMWSCKSLLGSQTMFLFEIMSFPLNIVNVHIVLDHSESLIKYLYYHDYRWIYMYVTWVNHVCQKYSLQIVHVSYSYWWISLLSWGKINHKTALHKVHCDYCITNFMYWCV